MSEVAIVTNDGLFQLERAAGEAAVGVKVQGIKVLGAQVATIADAVVAHSITDTATQLDAANELELEGFLDALGVKVNAILAALEAHGILAAA